MTEYLGLTLFNILTTLFLAVLAVAGMFWALRLRDRFAGIDWPKLRGKITSTPQAAAIYSAAWVIALGLILSAAIR
jgi:hypothetical protein